VNAVYLSIFYIEAGSRNWVDTLHNGQDITSKLRVSDYVGKHLLSKACKHELKDKQLTPEPNLYICCKFFI
jgi:hypothetical protein